MTRILIVAAVAALCMIVSPLPTQDQEASSESTGSAEAPGPAGIEELLAWGQQSPSFLGVAPATDGVLEAMFSGPAPTTPPPQVAGLQVKENLELERARLRYPDGHVVLPPLASAVVPTPKTAQGIGPGAHLIITIPGEGTFGCTANFVWQDGTDRYLGAAGHCFLPADEVATHGESPASANYDASGLKVEVCISQCFFGGQLGFLVTGELAELGDVAYARQTGPGGDVGNDFGVVAIPSGLFADVRTQMPMWGGPNAEGSVGSLDPLVMYGYGAGVGEVFATMGRAGTSIYNAATKAWTANLPAFQGDSGAAINTGVITADANVLVGDDAAGILTHLVVGTQIIAGTTIGQAKTMAGQASLSLSVET